MYEINTVGSASQESSKIMLLVATVLQQNINVM